jgi:hypothetical protein
MNNLREEFIECFMWSSKDNCWKLLPRRTPEKIFDWINQNYISKQQILNLECLKEEKTYTYFSSPKMNIDVRDITTGKITHWRKDKKYKHQSILTEEQILRNQLRKEIIEEIKKLVNSLLKK